MIKIQYTDPKLVSPQPGHGFFTSREPPWNSEVRERAALFAVGIWVSYVTSCYVTSCSVCPGSSVALGGGGGGGQTMGVLWGTRIGQFFFSIRKQHSVDKVHTL